MIMGEKHTPHKVLKRSSSGTHIESALRSASLCILSISIFLPERVHAACTAAHSALEVIDRVGKLPMFTR